MTFGANKAADARQLNAGFLLNEMSADEQIGYVSGVVEGLAYSRFLRERPSESGMQCVYSWYYGEKNRWPQMKKLFERHADKPVGVLLHVLIKKQCGA